MTLLLVSHDRYFLEAVTDEIWELEREKLYTYKGDYENYLEKKAARIESELASIDKAKNTFRKELEWMRKQPKARTTKSKSRQDNFYEVESKAKQKIEDTNLQLDMKMTRLGGKIIEAKKVYKSYGELVVLKGFDYTFSKGERIGIVGETGCGKSTLLDLLMALLTPTSGALKIDDQIIDPNLRRAWQAHRQRPASRWHAARATRYAGAARPTRPACPSRRSRPQLAPRRARSAARRA